MHVQFNGCTSYLVQFLMATGKDLLDVPCGSASLSVHKERFGITVALPPSSRQLQSIYTAYEITCTAHDIT